MIPNRSKHYFNPEFPYVTRRHRNNRPPKPILSPILILILIRSLS